MYRLYTTMLWNCHWIGVQFDGSNSVGSVRKSACAWSKVVASHEIHHFKSCFISLVSFLLLYYMHLVVGNWFSVQANTTRYNFALYFLHKLVTFKWHFECPSIEGCVTLTCCSKTCRPEVWNKIAFIVAMHAGRLGAIPELLMYIDEQCRWTISGFSFDRC